MNSLEKIVYKPFFQLFFHFQINGQIEVINRSLENFLCSYMGKTFNSRILSCLRLSLYIISLLNKLLVIVRLKLFIVKNPITPLDLTPLPITYHFSGDVEDRAKNIKKIQE